MRAPPPVSVQGAGGRFWGWLCAGLPGLALAAVLAWAAGHLLPHGPGVGPAVAALAGGGLLAAWLRWRHAPQPATLVWDGERWTLDGAEGAAVLMLDAQRLLLLRWWPAAAPRRPWRGRWLALSAAEAGGQLHLLRVALLAAHRPPPTGEAPGARAGSAE